MNVLCLKVNWTKVNKNKNTEIMNQKMKKNQNYNLTLIEMFLKTVFKYSLILLRQLGTEK